MEQRVEEAKSDADKFEILLWACARGLLPDVTALVTGGVDPNAKDKKGLRPVHYAAAKGHTEILRYLGSRGADLDAEDEGGRAPLHYASTWGHADAVRFLVQKGAWVDATDSRDDAALHLASRAGHTSVVNALLDAHAKYAMQNKRQLTAFGEAVVAEHLDTAAAIAARTDAQLQAGSGFTLLHVAAGLGKAAALKWLLQRPGARQQVNAAADADRTTPLHAAALGGSGECVQLLLSHGAKRDLLDAASLTPADVAARVDSDPGGRDRVLALLGATGQHPTRASSARAGPPTGSAHGAGGKQPLEHWMRQVDGLSRKPEDELQQLGPEARKGILQVQGLANVVECYSALLTMRTDPSFREDVSAPEVRAALEQVLRGQPHQHAGDAPVVAVLGKLRKLQTILSKHGRVKVTVEDLLTEPSPEEEQKKLASMRAALQAARDAAARALAGTSLEPSAEPSQEITEEPLENPSSSVAEPAAAQEPQGLLERLGKEFVAQLVQAAVMALVLLLVLWATKRLPWQSSAWWEQLLVQPSAPQTRPPPTPQQPLPQERAQPDFHGAEL